MSKIWRVKNLTTQRYRDHSTPREAIKDAFTDIYEHFIVGEEPIINLDINVVRTFDPDGNPDTCICVNGEHYLNVYRTEEDYAKPKRPPFTYSSSTA
jgi:hypothetical protein